MLYSQCGHSIGDWILTPRYLMVLTWGMFSSWSVYTLCAAGFFFLLNLITSHFDGLKCISQSACKQTNKKESAESIGCSAENNVEILAKSQVKEYVYHQSIPRPTTTANSTHGHCYYFYCSSSPVREVILWAATLFGILNSLTSLRTPWLQLLVFMTWATSEQNTIKVGV